MCVRTCVFTYLLSRNVHAYKRVSWDQTHTLFFTFLSHLSSLLLISVFLLPRSLTLQSYLHSPLSPLSISLLQTGKHDLYTHSTQYTALISGGYVKPEDVSRRGHVSQRIVGYVASGYLALECCATIWVRSCFQNSLGLKDSHTDTLYWWLLWCFQTSSNFFLSSKPRQSLLDHKNKMCSCRGVQKECSSSSETNRRVKSENKKKKRSNRTIWTEL